jgi:predicted dehydrogenase
MNKLRYGIIGCGNISPKHLKGYSALKDDVEIVAACDIVRERAERRAREYGIPDIYEDYRELLARGDIDFVSVCVPNLLHCQIAVDALNAGKHVHCEKPMAMNSDETKRMIEASEKSGRQLMIGLNNRFTPISQFVKRYVDEGRLGEIYFAKCGWKRRNGLSYAGWFSDKSMSGGGPLIDLGVHYIDLAMHFLGFPEVDKVLAKTYAKFGPTEKRAAYTFANCVPDLTTPFTVEDLATGFITMKNDAALQFEVAWASNVEREQVFYDLYGTEGGIHFHDFLDGSMRSGESHSELKIFHEIDGQMVTCEPVINPVVYKEGEFSHFVRAVRENTPPTISVKEQAAQTIRLIEAIYQSAETGKAVTMD